MKVINTLAVALALAVPISLVTADEQTLNNYAYIPGPEDYSPDMHEALKISPIGFEQIVVVPPGYDKPAEMDTVMVKNGIRLQNVNLPLTREVTAKTGILAP
jgi:hypothetical protein